MLLRSAPSHRRVPLISFALLTATLLTFAAAAVPHSVAAQEGEAPTIVGSWSLGFPNDDPSSRHLASFLPDGVVLMTNAPVFTEESVARDQIYSTAGHGAWIRQDDGSYAFTVLFLYFDAAEENWGTLTVDGVVTLDPSGDSFTGTFLAAATDEDGGPLLTTEEEPLSGARIIPRSRDAAPPLQ
jgi:hypothetical protein